MSERDAMMRHIQNDIAEFDRKLRGIDRDIERLEKRRSTLVHEQGRIESFIELWPTYVTVTAESSASPEGKLQ